VAVVATVTGAHGNPAYARLLEEDDVVNCEDAAALSEMGDEARRRVETLIDDSNIASSAEKTADEQQTSEEGRGDDQQDAVAKDAETADSDADAAEEGRYMPVLSVTVSLV